MIPQNMSGMIDRRQLLRFSITVPTNRELGKGQQVKKKRAGGESMKNEKMGKMDDPPELVTYTIFHVAPVQCHHT